MSVTKRGYCIHSHCVHSHCPRLLNCPKTGVPFQLLPTLKRGTIRFRDLEPLIYHWDDDIRRIAFMTTQAYNQESTMAPQKVRLATASPGTQGTLRETLAQLHQIARGAAAEGADILLLPEAYLGGYPRGTYFGCKIGSRTDQGRNEYLDYFKAAVDLGDTVGGGAGAGDAWVKRQLGRNVANDKPNVEGSASRGDGTREELERIARETGVFIITGLIEKAGGSLYCSAVYVCPKLGIIGKRRKTQPVCPISYITSNFHVSHWAFSMTSIFKKYALQVPRWIQTVYQTHLVAFPSKSLASTNSLLTHYQDQYRAFSVGTGLTGDTESREHNGQGCPNQSCSCDMLGELYASAETSL